jgi:hypothetical protein
VVVKKRIACKMSELLITENSRSALRQKYFLLIYLSSMGQKIKQFPICKKYLIFVPEMSEISADINFIIQLLLRLV